MRNIFITISLILIAIISTAQEKVNYTRYPSKWATGGGTDTSYVFLSGNANVNGRAGHYMKVGTDTAKVYFEGSTMYFYDPATGLKTLAQLASGGGGVADSVYVTLTSFRTYTDTISTRSLSELQLLNSTLDSTGNFTTNKATLQEITLNGTTLDTVGTIQDIVEATDFDIINTDSLEKVYIKNQATIEDSLIIERLASSAQPVLRSTATGNVDTIPVNTINAILATDAIDSMTVSKIKANNLIIDADTLIVNGAFYFSDSAWTDLRAPATTIRQGKDTKPEFNEDSLTLDFPNADSSEIAYIIMQMPHEYILGSDIEPHVHWLQSQNNCAEWVLLYRILENGEPTTQFTRLSSSNCIFTYTSGTITQITDFPMIDMSSVDGVSACLQFKLYRSETDAYTGDAQLIEFDVHYQRDGLGSDTEYTKVH